MTRTIEKVILAVVVVFLIGLNTLFISGQLDKSSITEAKTTKQVVVQQAPQTEDIGYEKVWEIARKAAPGTIQEVERGNENNRPVYEVDIMNNGVETEVLIDAKTGQVLRVEEDKNEEIPVADVVNVGGRLTQEQAIDIALQNIEGTVIGVTAEQEGGRLLYEVKLSARGDVAEVEIDAETGAVVEIEWGEDDD